MQRLYWQFGEDEPPEPHRQARQVMAELTVAGDLRVVTVQEGGEATASSTTSSRMQEAAFAWLDELRQR